MERLKNAAEVTTLRVVWIEIGGRRGTKEAGSVTTLRVVWIEIFEGNMCSLQARSHHLAGGVD